MALLMSMAQLIQAYQLTSLKQLFCVLFHLVKIQAICQVFETNTYFINTEHTVDVISISGDEVDDLINGDYGNRPVEQLSILMLMET